MKKQLIYKEVLAMLNEGIEYKAITMAEVARRCDMGKSTIYEYFKSKDDMVYNSIIYYANKMLKFFSQSFKISTYEPTLRIWVKSMIVCMKSNKWMVLPWTFKSYITYLNDEDSARIADLLEKSQGLIIKLLNAIAKKGLNEGYLSVVDETSVAFAYYGAIGTLAEYVDKDFDYNNEEGQNLVNIVMEQITKQMQ